MKQPMHIRTSVEAHDSVPAPAVLYKMWIERAMESANNPGVSFRKFREIAQRIANNSENYKGIRSYWDFEKTLEMEARKEMSKQTTVIIKKTRNSVDGILKN